ncbi:hypothetical protein [Xenorhabdus sp. IM139775]|uniref:hypothetical protein n=1 Tax=Xenorhabdus sp. IM139775 TaxID=3025876 RepID=UPI002359C9FE|nr:hypothetical protein [Xenorhabdus sp. IM139775]MDC9592524.1 hypothetical protein [Xenorhabdus sp. IM139775]
MVGDCIAQRIGDLVGQRAVLLIMGVIGPPATGGRYHPMQAVEFAGSQDNIADLNLRHQVARAERGVGFLDHRAVAVPDAGNPAKQVIAVFGFLPRGVNGSP